MNTNNQAHINWREVERRVVVRRPRLELDRWLFAAELLVTEQDAYRAARATRKAVAA